MICIYVGYRWTDKERIKPTFAFGHGLSYTQFAISNLRSDKVIKLERKKKYGSWIYKEDAPLTRDEFEQILAGDYDFLLRSPYPLCREFYIECICNMMRPRTIVDYEREPWVMDEGTVRITFDSNVRAAVGSFDIFDATLPALPVLEPGKLVMEVKFTEFCPQLVRDMVPPGAAELTAVSKYCLCYDRPPTCAVLTTGNRILGTEGIFRP